MGAATVSPVLRALLEHVVDYAGLFPPAALSMHEAVTEYAAHLAAPHAWLLGRFVVPVTRLRELAAEVKALDTGRQAAWAISALVSADPSGDTEFIRGFNRKHEGRLAVESAELRAVKVEAIDWALPQLDRTLERYVEIPLDEDPRPLLRAIKQHDGRAKARTGGVSADAFPSDQSLARFIAACAELDVPFKATAGLHHPLRGEQRLTYDPESLSATMFGFLDVFVAAALARSGADEATLQQLLEESDIGAFSINGDRLCWRDCSLDVTQVSAARHDFALSFGSCSFREPVDDLQHLGLL